MLLKPVGFYHDGQSQVWLGRGPFVHGLWGMVVARGSVEEARLTPGFQAE